MASVKVQRAWKTFNGLPGLSFHSSLTAFSWYRFCAWPCTDLTSLKLFCSLQHWGIAHDSLPSISMHFSCLAPSHSSGLVPYALSMAVPFFSLSSLEWDPSLNAPWYLNLILTPVNLWFNFLWQTLLPTLLKGKFLHCKDCILFMFLSCVL
jgi:hypothetical protein